MRTNTRTNTRNKTLGMTAGAVSAAGVAAVLLVAPAFGAAGSTSTPTSSSTTTTTVTTTSTTSSPNKTSGNCKKPYPPSAATVDLTATPTSVKTGGSVTFSGTVSYNGCPLAKEQVALNQVVNKKVTQVGSTLTTDNKGTFSTTYTPQATADYYAVFTGDADYLGAQSSTVTVTVTKK